jgi:transposase
MDRIQGQADLILRDGVFYLYVTIDMPTPPPINTTGVLGVDLGIVEIATDSEGNS